MKPLLLSGKAAILPLRPFRLFGGAVIALAIAALVALVFAAILNAAGAVTSSGSTSIDIAHLLRMTTIQATLSTLLSLLVGTGLAWSLNRLSFPGRDFVVGLFASAIVTPGIIVAFGLLTIWGRSGWINQTLGLLGFSIGNPIFGLPGILLAHTVLDAALAARILLARLDALPSVRLKTGQSLALSATQRFIIIDWPALRGTLPGLAAIIFLLAFTSFPIVLLLGGGPANQTLEVAIYSAVRLDFDLVGAVKLALTQIGVCTLVILVSSALAPVPASLGHSAAQSWADRGVARLSQVVILAICLIGFLLPLAAVLVDGLGRSLPSVLGSQSFWTATGTSLAVGAFSALLTLVFAIGLSIARAATARPLLRIGLAAPAYAYLAVPAVVLSLGFFLAVRKLGIAPETAAPAVVILANALLSLPFAIATLAPPLDALARSQGKLVRALGLSGWRQFQAVELPLIGRDIGVALTLAFCFSLGDLGVISLFGTEHFVTLPLLMYRAFGAYRGNDAAAIAALMLVMTIAVFIALPRIVERLARAQA